MEKNAGIITIVYTAIEAAADSIKESVDEWMRLTEYINTYAGTQHMTAVARIAVLFHSDKALLPFPRKPIDKQRLKAYDATFPSAAPKMPKPGCGTSRSDTTIFTKIPHERENSAYPILPAASSAVFIRVKSGRNTAAKESTASDGAPPADWDEGNSISSISKE